MKANRWAKRPEDDEAGVATVLGGILIAALIVMTLVMVRVNFVPQWEEQKEAAHLADIQDDLLLFRSNIDRQLDNTSASAITTPISLSRTSGNVFIGPSLGSDLEFTGTQTGSVELSAGSLLVQRKDGRTIAGIDEEWVSASSNGTLSDILSVDHLRLRLADPESGSDGDGILLTVTDANGAFAGSFELYTVDYPSGYKINSKVTNAAGSVLYDDGESRFQQDQPDYYWANALDANLLFDQVLAVAAAPLTFEMTNQGLEGTYTIQYTKLVGGNVIVVGGTGLQIDDYSASLDGGTMLVDWHPNRLPAQSYVMEHGAVWRIQDGVGTSYIDPSISIGVDNDLRSLNVHLPMLTGAADGRTGGTTPLTTLSTTSARYDAVATNYTIRIATGYPTLWSDAFLRAAEAGGLSSLEYTISTNSTDVSFTFEGPSSDPADYDVQVALRQAEIATTFPAR